MKTTHLCVNCEFLFICVVNVETKFKHCLVWGPFRGHILMKHCIPLTLYSQFLCVLVLDLQRRSADLGQNQPGPHLTTENYKLINNRIRLPRQTSSYMPLKLYFWFNKVLNLTTSCSYVNLLTSSDILASFKATSSDDIQFFFKGPIVVPRLFFFFNWGSS